VPKYLRETQKFKKEQQFHPVQEKENCTAKHKRKRKICQQLLLKEVVRLEAQGLMDLPPCNRMSMSEKVLHIAKAFRLLDLSPFYGDKHDHFTAGERIELIEDCAETVNWNGKAKIRMRQLYERNIVSDMLN
jgi:hypothetical protein